MLKITDLRKVRFFCSEHSKLSSVFISDKGLRAIFKVRGFKWSHLGKDHVKPSDFEGINLSFMNLKTLPMNDGTWENLTVLDVSHNMLTELPERIGVLINLTHLDVSHNLLAKLPETLKFLEKIKEVDLRHNDFKRLDRAIGDLRHLDKLYLRGNPLPMQIIRYLMELKKSRSQELFIDLFAGKIDDKKTILPLFQHNVNDGRIEL